MTTLLEKAKEVSCKYVCSLLYVDNHIYQRPDNDEKNVWVSSKSWVSACAKFEIAACLYEVVQESDKSIVASLMPRADICVIDWKMPLPANTDKESDADADQDAAKTLLYEYISKAKSMPGPRLLCVLSLDDSGVRSFVKGIDGCECLPDGGYVIKDTSVKIVVVKRDPDKYRELLREPFDIIAPDETMTEDSNDSDDLADSSSSDDSPVDENNEQNDNEVIRVECLVEYLMRQYAIMHKGIVPTFLLELLTDIRDRAPELMKRFSSALDCAYLVESALAAYPEYAPEMLTKAITDAIAFSYQYQQSSEDLLRDLVKGWCNDNKTKLAAEIKISDADKITLSKEELEKWLNSGLVRFSKLKISDETKRRKFLRDEKNLVKMAESLVVQAYRGNKSVKASCLRYARACSQKYAPTSNDKIVVRLTTGTVVKTTDGECLVCLQQGCDSLRILPDQPRRFFFLPIEEANSTDDHIATVTEDASKFLIPSRQAYRMEMIEFSAGSDDRTDICATRGDKGFEFKGSRNGKEEAFLWLFDLKKDIAMKIADDFAHQFSRVAVDGSEWLRLKGKDMMPLESEPPIVSEAQTKVDSEVVANRSTTKREETCVLQA